MVALLAGEPFDIDPVSCRWDFRVHVSDKPMIGGKVVQVFGADVGDITITGQFSSRTANVDGQLAFLKRMKRLSTVRADHPEAHPIRFFWPEQGWDFQVHLKEFSSPDGPTAVVHDPKVFAPKWQIVLFPVGGADKLKEASVTTFIERLSAGIGWRQTKYNGPGTYNEVMSILQGVGANTLDEFNAIAYGLGTAPSNVGSAPTASLGTGVGTPFATGRSLTAQEMLNLGLQTTGWRGEELVIMVATARHESGWNPRAVNKSSTRATGLWQINLAAHGDRFGTQEELMIPERNAQAAFAIWSSQGRGAWVSYTSGAYLQFMPEVTAAAQKLGIV
jgi:hypothetical protein